MAAPQSLVLWGPSFLPSEAQGPGAQLLGPVSAAAV